MWVTSALNVNFLLGVTFQLVTLQLATHIFAVPVEGFRIFKRQSGHDAPHWGYAADANEIPPEKWSSLYSTCGGSRQSPILIDTHKVQLDAGLDPIDFARYSEPSPGNIWTVVNNGHVVQFSGAFRTPPALRNGGLGAEYTFSQFHFHWGSIGSRGSEHVIDGKRYPLELHIVHTKANPGGADTATDSTALTVVGVLFELASANDIPNGHLDDIMQAVQRVINPNAPTNVTLTGLTLANLLPSSPVYYRYTGSLTTPPCSEAVVWTVMKQPLKITDTQLNALRALHRANDVPDHPAPDNQLEDNFRPVQKLNGRLVRSYDPSSTATATSAAASLSSPKNFMSLLTPLAGFITNLIMELQKP